MTSNTKAAGLSPATDKPNVFMPQIVLLAALVVALGSGVASGQGVRLDASMNAVAKEASDELNCEDCEVEEDELLGLLETGGKDRR